MKNFNEYDNENPQVWEQFVRFAREAKAKGFKHYSAKGIFEQIRWHTTTTASDGFKVNNNYTAYYARKMMVVYPEFQGFFRVRGEA